MPDTAKPTLVDAASQKPPFYRDATVIKWLAQVVTLLAVIAVLLFLSFEAKTNLAAKDNELTFDFINVDPGFNLSGGIDDTPATGGRALYVGMVNTIRLSIAGIISATILGVIIGVGRLSNNWIVNRVASIFIEYMRNIPLLVHILIFFAIFQTLGKLDAEPGPINGWLHVSNKGVSIPRIFISDGFYQWLVFLLIGFLIAYPIRRALFRHQEDTGQTTHFNLVGLGIIAIAGVIGWFAHPVFSWVGDIFDAVASVIDAIPQIVVQILLAVLSIAAAAWWIKRFLDSRRTPAGLAKLTDDDYFRMIFAGVGSVVAVAVIFIVWPGGSSWLLNSSRDFFHMLGDKFDASRTGSPIGALRPNIETRGKFANFGSDGLNLPQALASMYFGVVLYTAGYVAEIVRGGILAVPKGQTEASQALGLKRTTMLRKVILPQAFRVSLPPLGNQYLNLTKNTSLGVAVSYTDLVQVGQTLYNQTGRSLEVFAIWMLFYLACSLTISVVVNFFNVRLAIVER